MLDVGKSSSTMSVQEYETYDSRWHCNVARQIYREAVNDIYDLVAGYCGKLPYCFIDESCLAELKCPKIWYRGNKYEYQSSVQRKERLLHVHGIRFSNKEWTSDLLH